MHMAQLMPLPLTLCCFSEIPIGFTFLVPAHLGSPEKGPLNGCVCVCVSSLDFSFCLVDKNSKTSPFSLLSSSTMKTTLLGWC